MPSRGGQKAERKEPELDLHLLPRLLFPDQDGHDCWLGVSADGSAELGQALRGMSVFASLKWGCPMKHTMLATSLGIGLLASASALAMDSSALEQQDARLVQAGGAATTLQIGDRPVLLAADSTYLEQRSARLQKATGPKTPKQMQRRRSVRETTPWWR